MKYTKEDLYENMHIKWSHEYKVTEFNPLLAHFRLIGITAKYDKLYKVDDLLKYLNTGQCTELSKKPEIQYEIY